MREIKFRYAWEDGVGNGIVSGGFTLGQMMDYEYSSESVFDSITECNCKPTGESSYMDCNCMEIYKNYVQVCTEEYSGIKDHSDENIEIYEGDLIKLMGSKYIYEVRFENGSFVMYHHNRDYGLWGNLSRIKDNDFKGHKFIVTGNIHDKNTNS